MQIFQLRKAMTGLFLAGSLAGLSACDSSGTGVSVSGGVYYDSLLWNDYYYGHSRPPRPNPPVNRPPRPEHPIARPPVARPPIHRPPAGRPRPGRF